MKKTTLLSTLILAGCQIHTQPFDYVGNYAFSASKIRGRAGCSFSGVAKLKDNQLWLDISLPDEKKEILMYIKPVKNNIAVDVFTLNFDKRFRMMFYCRGGASLAGEYQKIK